MKLVKKGAEADIYQTTWNGSKAILKIRKPKPYRNPDLDSKIRKQRTLKESQAIVRTKSFGIYSPLIYFVNPERSSIYMQQIPGTPVHDLPGPKIVELADEIGRMAGILHKNGMTHGDLTTSNFIYNRRGVFMIDFGLSQSSVRPEDHAVDLRLIKEILNSAHAQIMQPAWGRFLSGYKSVVGTARHARILHLVSEIEGRGRYATVV